MALRLMLWAVDQLAGVKLRLAAEGLSWLPPLSSITTLALGWLRRARLIVSVAPPSTRLLLPPDWISSTPAPPPLKWPGLPRSAPLELREFWPSLMLASFQSALITKLASLPVGAQPLAFWLRIVPA